ncbi:redoxin domain-containing protein [Deferrisoma palaeochoriense]
MRGTRGTSFVLLVALCLFVVGLDSTSAAAFKRVHTGEPAPAFTLNDLDGNPVNLEDYRDGPLTILAFWALWSPRSIPLLQDLQKLKEEFGDKGLRVLTVNAEGQNAPSDLEARIRAAFQENGLDLPVLLDRDLEQYNAWGVIATPATAFLGKDLQVIYEFSGHPTSAYQDMRDQVMKALGLEEQVAAAAKPKRKRYEAAKPVMLQYGLAKTLFKRGQLSKAKRKLKKVLAQDPNFPDAQALQGAILLALSRQGKADKASAKEAFAKAVELDETVPLGLAGLAHFALEEGDVPKALELAKKAVSYTEDEDLPRLPPLDESQGASAAEKPAAESPAQPKEEAAATAPQGVEGSPTDATSGEAEAEPEKPTGVSESHPEGEPEGQVGGSEPQPAEGGPEQAAAPHDPTSPLAYLSRAEAQLAAGQAEAATQTLARVVDALIGIPEGPAMKGKALEMLKKLRSGE